MLMHGLTTHDAEMLKSISSKDENVKRTWERKGERKNMVKKIATVPTPTRIQAGQESKSRNKERGFKSSPGQTQLVEP